MNTFKKILPNILVIASIVCLTIFLLIWNVFQYEQAKKTLKKELNLHLEATFNEVDKTKLDSFIKRLDIQMPKNKSKGYFREFKNDSSDRLVVFIDSINVFDTKSSWFKSGLKKHQYDTEDSLESIEYKGIITKITSDKESKFPEGMNGSELFNLENSFHSEEDEKKVLESLKERLIKNGLPSGFVVVNDSTDTSKALVIDYNDSSFFAEKKQLAFNEHHSYLLATIFLAILFSVFLLSLVLLAFIVLMKSWKQQKRMVEIKNDFISNMTHELKTPISTVSVAIEAIRKYDVLQNKTKTEEYLDISSNELGRLSLLVEKVLRTTLFDSEDNFLNPQPIDLSLIVKETLHTMKMYFEEKRVKLDMTLAEGELYIMGDKVHLTNVVYNLIENAIKYSGETIEIQMITKREGASVYLIIADKGIGIAAEHQKQVFNKFYRVPNYNRHNVKGHGLGLSYVKQVVNELEGNIELKSQVGKGTSFIISFKTIEA